MILSKNVTPNLIAIAIIIGSFFVSGEAHDILLNIGLFALSGAFTNWLAVHMLFEKIPGLYGSGIVPLHFEDFKLAIRRLATEELFKSEMVEQTLTDNSEDSDGFDIDITPALVQLNLDKAFDKLVTVIMNSSFGGMLGMVGGETALEPMKEPFKEKIHEFLLETAKSNTFQSAIKSQLSAMSNSDAFINNIEKIIDARLNQLTPDLVKDIVKRMIKEHLGWLVVWGGVFGGLIGLLTSLVF